MSGDQDCGSLLSIRRHPVKSMIGQELDSVDLSEAGIRGDRAYALVDGTDGKVASAKNPKKWGEMLLCRAIFVEPVLPEGRLPAVRITRPDGSIVDSARQGADAALSRLFGREVRLVPRGDGEGREALQPTLEEYWPADVEGLSHSGVVTDEPMPPGTFFDLAPVHILTTATLRRLEEIHPSGDFDLRRFRPNLVVASPEGTSGFVENAWVGRTIRIGDEVELTITGPCPRCVMTTLAQGDLVQDVGVLRAAAGSNAANVGVYASVLRAGRVRTGDAVSLR